MRLRRYELKGYKAFASQLHPLEIAPITIVIGHNNSGKSALVRAPVLIADSLKDDSQMLSLNTRNLDFGQSYSDIFHRGGGDEPVPTITFVIDVDVESHGLRLETDIFLDYKPVKHQTTPVIRRWTLRDIASIPNPNGGLPGLPIDIVPLSSGEKIITVAGESFSQNISWNRLLPLPAWLLSRLTEIKGGSETFSLLMDLKRLGSSIHHLGPFRAVPARQYEVQDVEPLMEGDGKGAVELLAWDRRRGGTLLDDVSRWFKLERNFGFDLRLDGSSERAGMSSLSLVGDAGVAVNLSDAGSGIAQVLPLVVRRFQLEDPRWSDSLPTLQIIEQPELHLHPAACASLGDLFVDTALKGSMDILAETHSENLVLRIRRRIAEGQISPDKVAIYWVENEGGTAASFKRLAIEEDGWIEDWPDGVFTEDAEESRALARAMRGRS